MSFDTDKFEKAAYQHEVLAKKSGYITFMDTESCGIASAMLGAGRETKDSQIDFAAGIILRKKLEITWRQESLWQSSMQIRKNYLQQQN